MRKLIYKVLLNKSVINTPQRIQMPFGAKPISVAEQRGELAVWYEFDPAMKILRGLKCVDFWLVFTGTACDFEQSEPEFLGTVLVNDLVYHVYWED